MVFDWVKSIILNFWRSLFNIKKKKTVNLLLKD